MVRIFGEKKDLRKFEQALIESGIPVYRDEKKEKTEEGEKIKVKILAVDDEDFLPCIKRLQEIMDIPVRVKTKGKSISLIPSAIGEDLDVIDDPEYRIPKESGHKPVRSRLRYEGEEPASIGREWDDELGLEPF
jgi:hypothetical protein